MKTNAFLLSCFCLVANAERQPLWDLEWAKRTPLDVKIRSETLEVHGEILLVRRDLSYFSHAWQQEEIRIAGHLFYPKSAEQTPLPAVLLVTASENDARNTALNAHVVAFAIDRVGEGDSTGPADDYRNWLDLDEGADVRRSWMYHYVLSAIRGITYLSSLDVVRKDAVGITGTSRGGLCSLLVSAFDDRVALAVPVAATGDLGTTVQFPDNWLESLVLRPTGRTKEALAWRRFVEFYDPVHYKDRFHGLVWFINGAQDEFFPLTSTYAVTEGLSSPFRLELIADADHGYYAQDSGIYDTYNNSLEIGRRVVACLAKAIRVGLHKKGLLPNAPRMKGFVAHGRFHFTLWLDGREPIESVSLLSSTDEGWTFQRLPLWQNGRWHVEDGSVEAVAGDGEFTLEVSFTKETKGSSLAAFVEVGYRDEEGAYFLTSVPVLSEGFVPRIRPAPTF